MKKPAGKITYRLIESIDIPHLKVTDEILINVYLVEHDSGLWSGNDMDTDNVVENKPRAEVVAEIIAARIRAGKAEA